MVVRRLPLLLSLALALPTAHAADFSAKELEAARALQARLVTLDSHLDTPANFPRPDFDITRNHAGNGLSQVDLPRGTQSGLAQAVEVLEGIEGLEMVRFDSSDVVRHSLVSAIVDAYDAARGPAERSQKRGGARRGR